ncbi:MAG: DUF58 domain-containing protein [Pseudomonadales bacterium]
MKLRARAIVAVAGIALSGVAGQWLGYPLAGLWLLLTAALVLGLLLEYLTAQATPLQATLRPASHAYLGRPLALQLDICNASQRALTMRAQPLPPLALTGGVPEGSAALAPNESLTLNFEQIPNTLGEHQWPAQPAELTGVLGLASWIRWLPISANQGATATTTVEPDHLQQAQQRAAMDRSGARSNPLSSADGYEFRSLRRYVSGDAPARIDWKSSARSGALIVRETQPEQQLLLYFMIDCGRSSQLQIGSLNGLGHAVNVSARMAELASHAGDRFGLQIYAEQPLARLPPGQGQAHLRRLRGLLGDARGSAAESNPLAAVIAAARELPQRALIVLFTQLDDAEAAGQLARATALLRPRHLPLVVTVEDAWVNATAQAHESNVFTALAAREHRRTAQRTRAQLEQLGAIVVESPPQLIEAKVFARYRQLRADRSI